MPTINMLSSANKVKGQGVASAYIEQVNLVKNGLKNNYCIKENKFEFCDITHYHTIDLKFFLTMPFTQKIGSSIAHVHFVPDTIEDSLKLPQVVKTLFYKYIIWFYKSVDHLVVVNPCFIEVLKKYKIDEEKVTYIPNYVSEENFFRLDRAKIINIKEKFNIPIEKFVVLGVGQVQSRKGILDFIEVAKNLPNLQFVWAGGFSFGAITDGYEELKNIMKKPPKNVKFIGIIDRAEMNDIYNMADLMFLPSYNELFPMSVLEAMALKIPIILRDLEIYKDILFQYYLKGKNIKEFVSTINNIFTSKSEFNRWSDNSWKCHLLYSKERILSMWKEFYDSVYQCKNKINLRNQLDEK